jgi:acyl carrier protein
MSEPLSESSVVDQLRKSCFGAVLPEVEVNDDDDFFTLGGDSVQLIRLVALAQYEFDIEIRAVDFFVSPTLRTLTKIVEQELVAAVQRDAELIDGVLAEAAGGSAVGSR